MRINAFRIRNFSDADFWMSFRFMFRWCSYPCSNDFHIDAHIEVHTMFTEHCSDDALPSVGFKSLRSDFETCWDVWNVSHYELCSESKWAPLVLEKLYKGPLKRFGELRNIWLTEHVCLESKRWTECAVKSAVTRKAWAKLCVRS